VTSVWLRSPYVRDMTPRHWAVGSCTSRSSKMEALRSFETPGTYYRVERRHILEEEGRRFYMVVSSATQQLRLVLVKSVELPRRRCSQWYRVHLVSVLHLTETIGDGRHAAAVALHRANCCRSLLLTGQDCRWVE
jgi:hypothetical protein